jgi:hypothetical protein
MKITVSEDKAGELDGLTLDEVAGKLYSGFVKAAEQLLKGKAEAGGEIDALEELRDALEKGFTARLAAIKNEILEGVAAASRD